MKSGMNMILISILLSLSTICSGAKILGVFNHPGASHTFLGKVLLKNLAHRGHQVTMISAFPLEKPLKNYRDIYLHEFLNDLKRREEQYYENSVIRVRRLINMTAQHTEDTFKHKEVQQLIAQKEHFDLIIMDWFHNDASLMFGHIFNAPVIVSSSFGNNYQLNEISGNSLPFSYVPGLALPIADDISFSHRALITVANILLFNWLSYRITNIHNEILKRNFNNPPTVDELKKNIALILSNSHFYMETPRPYTPNIIPIGGFHVEEPLTLPTDEPTEENLIGLKKFMDGAVEGFIYFSMGSQVKIDFKDQNTLEIALKVFTKLPQRVLVKYSGVVKDLPKNVKIIKWAPQLQILAHSNIQLFISHGGALSFAESLHSGVPILCLPTYGDQWTNGAFIESRNLGKAIGMKNINEENFYDAITTILSNRTYAETAKNYSSFIKDQPVKPLENAIYWIEHVIKYKGAPHLQPFSVKLPFYKYYLLDVIGLFAAIIYIGYKLISYAFKLLLMTICYITGKKNTKKVKTN